MSGVGNPTGPGGPGSMIPGTLFQNNSGVWLNPLQGNYGQSPIQVNTHNIPNLNLPNTPVQVNFDQNTGKVFLNNAHIGKLVR